jgi:hypothetical protein
MIRTGKAIIKSGKCRVLARILLVIFSIAMLKNLFISLMLLHRRYSDLLHLLNNTFPDTFWHTNDSHPVPERTRVLNSSSVFLKDESVVVIACCKDVSEFLPVFRRNVEQIVALFGSYRILLGESDSSDSTLHFIQKWASDSKNVFVKTHGNLSTMISSRTERIAFCRNHLLNITRQKDWLFDSRYLLVMDVDINANNVLTTENFLSNFEYDIGSWAVMTASQTKTYYDIWALRAAGINYDCWITTNQYVHRDIAEKIYVTVHMRPIPRNFGLVHVYSAFGGFGVYQTHYLNDCWYQGMDELRRDRCEHISFHYCIRKNRGSIFVNPRFQNSDGQIH